MAAPDLLAGALPPVAPLAMPRQSLVHEADTDRPNLLLRLWEAFTARAGH